MLNYTEIENFIEHFKKSSPIEIYQIYLELVNRIEVITLNAKYRERKLTESEKERIKETKFLMYLIKEVRKDLLK